MDAVKSANKPFAPQYTAQPVQASKNTQASNADQAAQLQAQRARDNGTANAKSQPPKPNLDNQGKPIGTTLSVSA